MKNIAYFFIGAIPLMIFVTGCQDKLDIPTNGPTLTLEQVKAGAEISKDRAEAGLPGMYAKMNEYNVVYEFQGDFGYPSYCCRIEERGDNVVSTTHGYNWFGSNLTYRGTQNKNSVNSNWAWNYSYKVIKLANDIIQTGRGSEDPNIKVVLGQALAFRAFHYLFLAQNFQFTYKGHENDLCVPIVTDETPADELSNNPRKTVREVYDLIIRDLNESVENLKGFVPETKTFISEATAYGIRCRVYMLMQEWDKAAADAQAAIQISKAQPFSIEDCSIPNFDDVQAARNALWGIIITQEDAVTKTGIANWTSMFTSLCWGNGGYTTLVNTYKMINLRLFELIPLTDVRKGWWTYQKVEVGKDKAGKPVYGYTSPLLHKAYPNEERFLASRLLPFSVVKFAPNEKNLMSEVNAVDFMLMRVEEMYYNWAESKAMGGDFAAGKQILEDFVRTYRDPEFKSQATDAKSLQDEIYFQKRVEFWGEGINWYEMMRLEKGVNRIDVTNKDTGGYPALTRFNIAPNDPILVLQIPESEEQQNKAVEGHNNPLGIEPSDQI